MIGRFPSEISINSSSLFTTNIIGEFKKFTIPLGNKLRSKVERGLDGGCDDTKTRASPEQDTLPAASGERGGRPLSRVSSLEICTIVGF